MRTTAPLVSVVTPFYNTAEFLEQAIRSVLAQSYEHFEYILSDNCSTDGSLQIAQRYAEQDPRIKVHTHTEFIDQDPNYNRALRYISPESRYCKIVQADDWIYPRCLAEMVALAEAHPSVGIVSCCYLAGDSIAGDGLPFDRNVFAGREACRARLLRGGTFFGSATCLLYRSEITRQRVPFFAPNRINSDTTACFEILTEWDFARVPQILAGLRRGQVSTSTRLERLQASYFVNFALVSAYGRRYLTESELTSRLRTVRHEYLQALARATIRLRGQEYWRFHKQLLGSIGLGIPWGSVCGEIARLLAGKLLNPGQLVEAAIAACRRA